MTAVIAFAGPSLRRADVAELSAVAAGRGVQLDVRPPARRHDLLDLSGAGPAVVLLDGEFGQSLAVSIAEVRDVLAAGLRLHGASSMGVLRALECRTLGMTGSGWVFEQYRSGRIESDADVALLFDPYDYSPVTIPLVNVRWLVEKLARSARISAAGGAAALEAAAAVHYRDRRPSVLARRWRAELPDDVLRVLEPELADDRRDDWDRKRLDGIAALRTAIGD